MAGTAVTFEHLDDQSPPRMDQGRWSKIQQRSQRLRRRTRIQTQLVAATVVIVLGTIAATQVPSRTSKVEIAFEPSSSSSPSVPKPSLPARSGPTQAELTTAFYAMLGCYEDHGVVVNRVESHMDIYEYSVELKTQYGGPKQSSTKPVGSRSSTSETKVSMPQSTSTADSRDQVTATTADPASTEEICGAPFRTLSMLWSNGRGPLPKERWTAEVNECLLRNGIAPDSTMSRENWRVRSECVSQANKNVLIFITRVEGVVQDVGG